MKTPFLYEMTWPEVREYTKSNDIAILPVGSVEQHGPHMPLGTDHLIAQTFAKEIANRTGVLCLPLLPYGWSANHRQFHGTIWVRPEILKEFVKDICLSLYFHGIRKVIIVNGHGRNFPYLYRVAEELRADSKVFVLIYQWWIASIKFTPGLFVEKERAINSHAGIEETSLLSALHPRVVKMENAVDEKVRHLVPEGVGLFWDRQTPDYTTSGVFGISTTASADKGNVIFEKLIPEIVKYIEELKTIDIESLMPKPHNE